MPLYAVGTVDAEIKLSNECDCLLLQFLSVHDQHEEYLKQSSKYDSYKTTKVNNKTKYASQ